MKWFINFNPAGRLTRRIDELLIYFSRSCWCENVSATFLHLAAVSVGGSQVSLSSKQSLRWPDGGVIRWFCRIKVRLRLSALTLMLARGLRFGYFAQ